MVEYSLRSKASSLTAPPLEPFLCLGAVAAVAVLAGGQATSRTTTTSRRIERPRIGAARWRGSLLAYAIGWRRIGLLLGVGGVQEVDVARECKRKERKWRRSEEAESNVRGKWN